MTIHKHYNELTNDERDFVDAAFDEIFRNAKAEGIRLNGADPAERAVEAMATFILESRPKIDEPKPKFGPPVPVQFPTMTKAEKLEAEQIAFDKWAGNVRP